MAVNCSVNANPGQHNNKQLIHFWNVKEYLKEMKGEFHNTATLLPLMDIKDINNELTIEFAESKVVKCYKSSVSYHSQSLKIFAMVHYSVVFFLQMNSERRTFSSLLKLSFP